MSEHRDQPPDVADLRKTADLQPDPINANRGTTRGRVLLESSINTCGAGRSVVADRRGVVIAGNKVVEQAKALGLPIRVVTTTGDALVVVQRADLDLATDARARTLAIADNRVAELDLDWDAEVLEELRQRGLDVQTWWTDAEWQSLGGGAIDTDPAEDRSIEPPNTTIGRGDLFALGRHRVMCGDATNAADVTRLLGQQAPRLMVTDPPYGVCYDPAWRQRAYPGQRTAVGQVANDTQATWPEAFQLFPGDILYVWHAGLQAAAVAAVLEGVGFSIRAQIIWVKQHFALSRGNYHWQHEPCWFAVRAGATSHWQGDRTQTTVWQVPNLNVMGGNRTGEDVPSGHSTQKPVRLFEIPIRNHTTTGDTVYDPFVGSGTAVIAAEKTGRVALTMDLDPRYVRATVTRWETFTGQQAVKVGAGPAEGGDV